MSLQWIISGLSALGALVAAGATIWLACIANQWRSQMRATKGYESFEACLRAFGTFYNALTLIRADYVGLVRRVDRMADHTWRDGIARLGVRYSDAWRAFEAESFAAIQLDPALDAVVRTANSVLYQRLHPALVRSREDTVANAGDLAGLTLGDVEDVQALVEQVDDLFDIGYESSELAAIRDRLRELLDLPAREEGNEGAHFR